MRASGHSTDFKAGKITALVATEVAARGLDIKELPYVVNYELPNVPEDYVHRIGRTARAGGTGCAISLVAPDEAGLLKDIERVLRRSLPVAATPEFDRDRGAATGASSRGTARAHFAAAAARPPPLAALGRPQLRLPRRPAVQLVSRLTGAPSAILVQHTGRR